MKTVLKKAAALILSLALIMSMMTIISVSADYDPSQTREDFKMWGENEVYIQNANDRVDFMFTAEYSGNYIISTNEKEIDPVVKVYDYKLDLIADETNISDENKNVSYLVSFEAGAVYYIETYINGNESDVMYTIYSEPENPIESFDVVSTDGRYSMYPNEYIYLQPANFVPENFQNHGFSWKSSDENVAIVDQSGNVRGVSAGTAVISAIGSFGVTSTVTITVVPYTVLNEGETTEVIINEEGQKSSFEFIPEVSGNYIFTVDAEKEVSLHVWSDIAGLNTLQSISQERNYTILYLSDGISYYIETEFSDYGIGSYTFDCSRYAEEVIIGCNDHEVIGNTITGVVGDTAQLYVDFLPEGSKKETVTWSSENERVATVSEDGVVTFNQPGYAYIYAQTSTGHSTSIRIGVVMPVLNINFGEPLDVEFTENCSNRRIKFEPTVSGLFKLVPNEDVWDYAYIYVYDQNDNQLTYGSGSNNLEVGYYFEAGNTYYFEVESYSGPRILPLILKDAEYVEDFFMSCDSHTIHLGLPMRVKAIKSEYPDKNLAEKFTYRVNDETVATLETVSNSEVKIKGIKEGTVTLTATSQTGIEKSLTFTVTEAMILEEDSEISISFTESIRESVYKFVPTETAKYEFYFEVIGSGKILYAHLKDETGFLKTVNGSNEGFKLQYELEAGKTYFLSLNSEFELNATVGVTKARILEGIMINGGDESVSGTEGKYITLKLDTLPLHADYGNIEWSINDDSIAIVNDRIENEVVLRLQNEGQCELTATLGDYTDTITVNVTGIPELELDTPVEVTVSNENNETKFKFIPETDGEYVFYSTGDADPYAYLEQYGQITEDHDGGDGYNYKIVYSLSAGQTYYIRSFKRAEDESITFNVVVSKAVDVETITFDKTEINLKVGEFETVTYVLGPINCKNEEVFWISRNPEVAIIENIYGSGVEIRAVSSGTAVISAVTPSGAINTFTVNVEGADELVIGSANTVEITEVWERKEFILNIEESGIYKFYSQNYIGMCFMGIRQGNSEYENFYSDNQSNFSFQKMLKAGTYQIITGYNVPCVGSYEVYVQKTVTPESVIINNGEESIEVYVGNYQKLNVTLFPQFSNEADVVWSSSDDSIVRVENGVVYAVGKGTATVTATLPNGFEDTITVNCKEAKFLTVGSPQSLELGANGENVFYNVNIEQEGWYLFNISSSNHIGISIYDSNMNSMGDYGYGMRVCNYMVPGIYYIAITNCSDQSGTANCFIAKAPNITGLEIESFPDKMQHEIDTDFDYTGLVVKATFENGQTATWAWGTGALLGGYYNVGVREETDENGDYSYTVIYAGGYSISFTLEIVESNVVGFEVYSGSVAPFYENWDGHKCGDHYHYNYHRFLGDFKFIIRYRDGSYKIASYYENVDGYNIVDAGYKCDEPWTVGGDNYIYFCYRNLETKFAVELLENPVESIVVNTVPETEIIFGDGEYGWMDGDGYYLYWEDLSGLTFTVNYKDGTSKTFAGEDAAYSYGSYYWDGMLGYISSDTISEPGVYTAEFWFMNNRVEFELIVKASPVTDIEIVKDPDKINFKNGYQPDFKGLQIRVTYSDGTQKLITADSNTLVYEPYLGMAGVRWYIKDGDNLIEILLDWNDNGDTFYKAQYFDVSAIGAVLEFDYTQYENVSVDNINVTGQGMTVTVDGEIFIFDDVEFIGDISESSIYYMGYKEASNGLLQYSVVTMFDYNGYVTEYIVYVFGKECVFDVLSGDFNGDGFVDVRDLVAAKNASADMTEPENKLNSDMNFDGKFDALDLPLYIKRLLNVHA